MTVPCEIAGRIEKKRDRDWYSFTAKKGQVLSIELYGDRLGSPLDLYAVLKSAGPKGNTIVELDDNNEQVPNQFFTPRRGPAALPVQGAGGRDVPAAGVQPRRRRRGRPAPAVPRPHHRGEARLPRGR